MEWRSSAAERSTSRRRIVRAATAFAIVLGGGQVRPAEATPMLSVPNTRFDPLLGAAGEAPFSTIVGQNIQSDLSCDYWLVQRSIPINDAWRASVESHAATILGVFQENAFLVRIPGGQGGALATLQPNWAGPYLPAYKIGHGLAPAITGGSLVGLLDADGKLPLRAVFHRGEDPLDYVAALTPLLPGAEITGIVAPERAGSEGALRGWMVRIDANGAQGAPNVATAVAALARCEAVLSVETWYAPEFALNEEVWHLQTAIPRNDPGVPDGYDTVAKLFARGVTGRGQVGGMLDRGFLPLITQACSIRYGPNASDDPPPALLMLPSSQLSDPGDPHFRPFNKVIAHYLLEGDPPSSCQPVGGAINHGSQTIQPEVGDSFVVPAARAGLSLDDPTDDEESSDPQRPLDDLTSLIDHHQDRDGLAPGAQVVIQDFHPDPLLGAIECRYALEDMLEQAYRTGPGVRVHNNSWGWPNDRDTYSFNEIALDRSAWRFRDLLTVHSGGNGAGEIAFGIRREAGCKSGLAVAITCAPDCGVYPAESVIGSAHGPGHRFRVKPDLAGGALVRIPWAWSADQTSLPDEVFPCGGSTLAAAGAGPGSGTSITAPEISGLALDIRQYFVDGYHPGGAAGSSAGFAPTNALLKAVLLNSTRNLAGIRTADVGAGIAARPTFGQGWGWPVVDDTLFFAGDPTPGAPLNPRERSFLLVLTDTPNGVQNASFLNDGRGQLVSAMRSAILQGQIHEFVVCVANSEDLHVTLAWSDPPGPPGSGPNGADPLVNDLDLEIVDPDGKVWRSNPGISSDPGADPNRLWSQAYSTVSVAGAAPAGRCPAGCAHCPVGTPENLHEQEAPYCDMVTRDRFNTVENIFISHDAPPGSGTPNPDFVEGTYTIRVVGFRVTGNGETGVNAYPNWVTGDASPDDHDVIDDRWQGYALIASGQVAAPKGSVNFDKSYYGCGDFARVIVHDCSAGLTPFVDVTTAAGDCDRFAVTDIVGPDFAVATTVFQIADTQDGTAPGTCANTDGIVVAPDDSDIIVTYLDTVPGPTTTARAAARVTCRNVKFDSVTVVDACDAAVENGALNPNELARIEVQVENVGTRTVNDLVGVLYPFDEAITPQPVAATFGPAVLPGATFATAVFPVLVGPDIPCDPSAPPRFRCELSGADGFKDRLYFSVPIDCTPGTAVDSLRPGEVPARDSGGVVAMRATKPGNVSLANVDLRLTWDDAPGALRYNIWRGEISSFRGQPDGGPYSHVIPIAVGSPFCNVAGLAGPNIRDLLGEAVHLGGPDGSKYYLITAESECGSGATLVTIDGPWGFADRDLDGIDDPDELLPAGGVVDPGCTP